MTSCGIGYLGTLAKAIVNGYLNVLYLAYFIAKHNQELQFINKVHVYKSRLLII